MQSLQKKIACFFVISLCALISSCFAQGGNHLKDFLGLYPVPVEEGILTVDIQDYKGNVEPLFVQIFDISGRKVYQSHTFSSSEKFVALNLEKLYKGTYFVTVHLGSEVTSRRITVH